MGLLVKRIIFKTYFFSRSYLNTKLLISFRAHEKSISFFEFIVEQFFFHAVSYVLYAYTPNITFATRMFAFFQMIIHYFKVS